MAIKNIDTGETIASGMAEVLANEEFQKIFHTQTPLSEKPVEQSEDNAESFQTFAGMDESCAKDKCKCGCKGCSCSKGEKSCKGCDCDCNKAYASSLKYIVDSLTKISAALDNMGLEVGSGEVLKVLGGLLYEVSLVKQAEEEPEKELEEELAVSEDDEQEGEHTETHQDEERLAGELEDRIKDMVGPSEHHSEKDKLLHCKFCDKFQIPLFYKSKKGKTKSGFQKLVEHVMSSHPEEQERLTKWISGGEKSKPHKEMVEEAYPEVESEELSAKDKSVSPEPGLKEAKLIESFQALKLWAGDEMTDLEKKEASLEDDLENLEDMLLDYTTD